MTYELEEYVTANGRAPFAEWLLSLKDHVVRARLTARIDRAAHGNFGDWKTLSGAVGLFEMRDSYGPGYRIFYAIVEGKIILLLAGSAKRDQARTIAKAKGYLDDYRTRTRR
jgi:putative addiction module killer protein